MVTSIPIHTTLNPHLLFRNSTFLQQATPLTRSAFTFTPSAKLDLSETMGGRGLCNGERGIRHELQRTTMEQPPSPPLASPPAPAPPSVVGVGEGAFEKELFGLTGGFPGGEKGLKDFIQQNPSPSEAKARAGGEESIAVLLARAKPKLPELPLFLPGMIVIVKNPKNPFHMYSGIVQRVTDGKAGVLFEGGGGELHLSFMLRFCLGPKQVVLTLIGGGKYARRRRGR
ncbi:NAD(P)H-quinone oxidoreductase subunit S, chloroplastic-like [Zingiber officinale]|uniref:NAD(P)H-quinone oxidoreductase subunit S, chloroplastic-like n=1 Tax=Zingiber officinale TaxID=94328 RepID=UPI001C4D5D9B|nr:NAD(P)H-quinone oxidoreductase subunit S, chloroplastic-like [Zingiber officinale]